MKNFELKKVSKKFIIGLIFLFLVAVFINILSNIKNNVGVNNVCILFYGDLSEQMGMIEVYRLSPTSLNHHKIEPSNNNTFESNKKYFKKIILKIDNSSLNKVDKVEVLIGSNKFIYSIDELNDKWKSHTNNNVVIYESPDEINISTSIFPSFRNIINWGGDFRIIIFSFFEILFVFLVFFSMFFFVNLFRNLNEVRVINISFIIITILLFTISLLFIRSRGTGDVSYFLGWMDKAQQFGVVKGFGKIMDNYPPFGYMLVVLVDNLARIIEVDRFIILKYSLLVFLLMTSVMFYYFTKDLFISLTTYAFLMINPIGLGYIDIYFAPFLVGSLFFLKKRKYILFSILFSMCCLIKYQPVMISPFIFIYILNIESIFDLKKIDYKLLFIKVAGPAVVISLFLLVVFRLDFIMSFWRALNHHTLAPNALNINWAIQYFMDRLNNVTTFNITTSNLLFPRILFYGTYGFLLYSFFRKTKTFELLILYSLIGYFTYFMFNIGVHENHLFVLCILAPILFYIDKRFKTSYIILGIISNINLFVFYGLGSGISAILGDYSIVFRLTFSILNFIVYLFLIAMTLNYKLRAKT